MKRALFAAATTLFITQHAHAATPCADLTLDAQGAATVHDHVPDVLPQCYALTVRAGQQVTIDISKADAMGFGVESVPPSGDITVVADNQQSYHFTSEVGTYRILASSAASHGDPSHMFTLNIQVK